jgi:hypothetical protein
LTRRAHRQRAWRSARRTAAGLDGQSLSLAATLVTFKLEVMNCIDEREAAERMS